MRGKAVPGAAEEAAAAAAAAAEALEREKQAACSRGFKQTPKWTAVVIVAVCFRYPHGQTCARLQHKGDSRDVL